MDKNNDDFLFVTDAEGHLNGCLSIQEVRHALAKEGTLDKTVAEVACSDVACVKKGSHISTFIECFLSEEVSVLPILDEEGKICDYLTKQQLHYSLLSDNRKEWEGTFLHTEDRSIDYDVYGRPWGFYKTLAMNNYFQTKIICVHPDSQLSLQSHFKREEHWIVTHGTGTVQLGEEIIPVKKGSTLFIPKECKHRLTNTDRTESLILIEVQLGEYFGEDDIVRYEDIYGRV